MKHQGRCHGVRNVSLFHEISTLVMNMSKPLNAQCRMLEICYKCPGFYIKCWLVRQSSVDTLGPQRTRSTKTTVMEKRSEQLLSGAHGEIWRQQHSIELAGAK